MRIAINGFGRIGRAIFRNAIERKIPVAVINHSHGVRDAEYLLKYDSIYGRFNGKVSVKGDYLFVNRKKILIIGERDITKLPWKKLKIDTVIDSTGAFKDRKSLSQHFKSGAKRVFVTAPSEGVDITVVPGVNDNKLNKSDKIISVASCTTNALAPVTKILMDSFGVKNEVMTTIHAYTSSQSLVGGSHKKPRRGRSATLNLIPTTTGASIAVEKVLPKLKGAISGLAVRVPVAVVSLVDVVAQVKKKVTVNMIKQAFKKASKKEMKGIVGYTDENLVSSDFIGDSRSAIVDGNSIQVEGELVKVLVWYDNEWGYSNRVLDVVKKLAL
jgi:glyceraldehyde 3-phosphate dehydrogenase